MIADATVSAATNSRYGSPSALAYPVHRPVPSRRGRDSATRTSTTEGSADELGDGILASTTTCFRGYIAMLQGHHRAAIRATAAALGTPGAHPTQVAYDTLQSAQAYAELGDSQEAKNLLRRASDLLTNAGEPPASVYWYTEPFLRMNIGQAQHAIGKTEMQPSQFAAVLLSFPPISRIQNGQMSTGRYSRRQQVKLTDILPASPNNSLYLKRKPACDHTSGLYLCPRTRVTILVLKTSPRP
jgi:hypothetical protein